MKKLSTPKQIWIPLLVGFSAVIGATNASAISITAKPSKPVIQAIRSTAKSSKGTVDVSVSFSMASTNSKSPIQQTQVKVGTKICTANRTAKKCTVKSVVAGKTYKVLVRAKNRNGFGAWSSGVSFVAKSRSSWMRTVTTMPSIATTMPIVATTMPIVATTVPATTTTTTLPVLRTDLTKATVLGISTVKLAKVGGISSSGVQSTRVRKHAVGDVIFKTSGIVAYAQADTSSQSGSKLLAVSTSGAVSDAISSGTAVVKDFYSAPNGNVYIVFESKVALTTGGTTCILAVVDVSNGQPTCVDSTLDLIKWGLGYQLPGNPPIQFDSSGAVYFAGQVGSSAVLRKAKNGAITDLINDNVTLQDFIVLSDGTVIAAGETTSSRARWLRRISVTGGLKNLAIGEVNSLHKFADGKVYAGLQNYDPSPGFKRYSTELDALEDKFWISGPKGISKDSYFYVDQYGGIPDCNSENYTKNQVFCNGYGTQVAPVFNILGQKTFAVAGFSGQSRQLWQVYPIAEKTNVTAINNVTLAQQIITTMILAGTSSTGSNILSLYDTSSKQETIVMDGSNEVEIYSMSYSQKKNTIMFSGLRFSDNKYVVGEVSLG
jgi:hypothetical protein